MKVGFGLGHMGAGRAVTQLKAGHEGTVYNRTRAKAEALTAVQLTAKDEHDLTAQIHPRPARSRGS